MQKLLICLYSVLTISFTFGNQLLSQSESGLKYECFEVQDSVATPTLFVPEIFSPNSDGVNDVLDVFGNYNEIRLFIYSLSGEIVYIMNPNRIPWDGTMSGNDMPNGVYFWEAFFTGDDGIEHTEKGKVTLIR